MAVMTWQLYRRKGGARHAVRVEPRPVCCRRRPRPHRARSHTPPHKRTMSADSQQAPTWNRPSPASHSSSGRSSIYQPTHPPALPAHLEQAQPHQPQQQRVALAGLQVLGQPAQLLRCSTEKKVVRRIVEAAHMHTDSRLSWQMQSPRCGWERCPGHAPTKKQASRARPAACRKATRSAPLITADAEIATPACSWRERERQAAPVVPTHLQKRHQVRPLLAARRRLAQPPARGRSAGAGRARSSARLGQRALLARKRAASMCQCRSASAGPAGKHAKKRKQRPARQPDAHKPTGRAPGRTRGPGAAP